MQAIHFISGLPRSGSTLLAAVLKQNPRFHAGMSSPLAGMFGAMQTVLSGKNEFSVFVTPAKREAILRGLFSNYYSDVAADVVFDTNRAWCAKVNGLAQLFPRTRLICCVRPIVSIIDSFERLIQANALEPSRMFRYEAAGSVYSRADEMLRPEGVIGSAMHGLKQACYGPLSDRLLLVPYDRLTTEPEAVIKEIYRFIDEPLFDHRFDEIEYDADAFDAKLGLPALHRVERRITPCDRAPSLPPDLMARFVEHAFWTEPSAPLVRVA